MADFDFVIPLSLQSLEESSSSNQYVVASVLTAWEVGKKITEVQGVMRQEGPEFILQEKCFDTLYSVLVNFASTDEVVQCKSWDLLLKAMGKLASELGCIMNDDLTGAAKHKWLNIVKMTTFIACKLTEELENKCNKASADILATGRGRKKAVRDDDQSQCWEEDRNSMLVHLYSLVQHPLQRLWNPPVVEDDFVILIGDCCYKMLESPNMGLVRTKDTRSSLFQIIGTLVKKFNHGLGCALKLMQLLRQYEHMVTPAAQGVILLIQTFGDTFVLAEIIKEISRVGRNDVKDTSGLRNFTQFLIEVSSTCPQMIVPSLSLLITFLDEEVYSLRNCVLVIMGSVVLNVLSGDNLEPKSKDLRDQCLEHLEDHIHDVHAYVRSKVLQIWNDLIREKAVPLSRQHYVLKLVLGRLWDKSSLVRKNAIQLLITFVNSNPYAAKLPLEELESQCALELKKLQELSPGINVDSLASEEVPAEENSTSKKIWISMMPKVIRAVQQVLEEDKMECEEDEDNLEGGGNNLSSILKDIAEVLTSKKIERAVRLLQKALEKFSGAEVLSYNPEQHSSKHYEEVTEEELTHIQIHFLVVLERIFLSAKKMEEEKSLPEEKDEATDSSNENEELKSEINKQKTLVTYLKDSVKFAKLIQQGLPVMCQLLGSKQVSDVMEAISFFVTAFEFGVLDAMTGVRKMLMLVWSKEQEVKAAVVGAYRRLYMNSDTHSGRTQALQIVENLSSLIVGATMGERTSLEEIVSQFVSSGGITKPCITLLWERFTKALPDTTDEEAHTALILLAMCASAEHSIISSNLDVLTASGLGERGEQDFALVKEICHALLKVAVIKPKTDAPTAPHRLDRDHEIFHRLSKILIQGLTNLQDRQYSPMAVKAVSAIYALSEHPDLICGEIIQEMYQALENYQVKRNESPKASMINVSAGVLTRFCVVLGHVALCQLVHLDVYVFSELKRRSNLRDEMEIEKKRKKTSKRTKKSHPSTACDMSKGSQETDPDEEMGLVGAVADDMEAEYIRFVCETDLLSSDNLLGILKPMVWSLCTNPDKYMNTELQAASSLALAKYMMVSSTACENNLQLLFTILEKSKDDDVRANLVIALGDLYFKFPNQLEPWTPRFYARLRDSSSKVRQNTLTILTHLVLNDMVKVKRHISDIAFCICDEDPHISGLASLFFHELARKGNTLYNVLPDMISRLSDPEVGVEEQFFRKIIGEVLNLIQKDKHWENLVEKLCHRFQATINVRQWRDIAYCLSQLQFNEKCIRKLSENFACYADKLHEPEVYEIFMEIISNVQKTVNAKPEVKVLVEELEKRIVESHEKGVEDENTAKKAVGAKLKVTNSSTARKTSKNNRRKKSKYSSSESGSEDEDTRQQLHPVHRSNKENLRRSTRPLNASARKLQQNSDGSEEEEEEEESPSEASDEKQDNKVAPRNPLIVSNSRSLRKSRRNQSEVY